jgi:protein subunit release factor B
MNERKLLFSVTKKDFEEQRFRSGGKGGQHQNKTETGVRLIHKASGARGEARDSRSQHLNRKQAFKRLIASDKFKAWLKMETAIKSKEFQDINKIVNELMEEKNLKIEFF